MDLAVLDSNSLCLARGLLLSFVCVSASLLLYKTGRQPGLGSEVRTYWVTMACFVPIKRSRAVLPHCGERCCKQFGSAVGVALGKTASITLILRVAGRVLAPGFTEELNVKSALH